MRYLDHRHLRYLYRPSEGKFVLLRGLDIGHTPSDLHQMKSGLSLEDHTLRYANPILCLVLPASAVLCLVGKPAMGRTPSRFQ